MELFAVLASEEEFQEDMLRGFRLALDKILHFRRLRKVWHRFYGPQDVISSASDCPLLLDPTDPSNNLLARDRIPYFEKLAEYASCTLERLRCLEFGIPDLVVELFRPQPDLWLQMPFVPRQSSFLVGGEGQNAEFVQPFPIMNRPVCPQGEMSVLAHMLHTMLAARRFAILEAQGQAPSSEKLHQLILEDARHKLEQCINKTFGTVSWTPSSQSFENKSVVLVLPIGDGHFIQAGFEVDHKPEVAHIKRMSESHSHYWPQRQVPRMTAYSVK